MTDLVDEKFLAARRAEHLAIEANGYEQVRLLSSGEWAGLKNLIYCHAVCVGMGERRGHTAMFCFDTRSEAEQALWSWSGRGHPPGYTPKLPEAK